MDFLKEMKGKLSDLKEGKGGGTKEFDVIFKKPQLGLSLGKDNATGAARVNDVLNGSEASGKVQKGDVVVGIEGTSSPGYNELVAVAGAIGRPVTLTFRREGKQAAEGKKGGKKTGSTGFALGKKGAIGGNAASQLKPPPPLTDAEKREQRAAALKAAEDRTKAWDKKGQRARQIQQERREDGTQNGEINNEFGPSNSEATRRMVEAVKASEAHTASQLGYNPFEAQIGPTRMAAAAVAGARAGAGAEGDGGGAAGGGGSLSSQPAPGNPSSLPTSVSNASVGSLGASSSSGTGGVAVAPEAFVGERASIASHLDEAIGFMETRVREDTEGEGGAVERGAAEVCTAALKTIGKVLGNVSTGEAKFRRVRLNNPAFHAKVAGVEGAIDILTAAGFELQSDEEDAFLVYEGEGEGGVAAAAAGGAGGGQGSSPQVSIRLDVAMERVQLALSRWGDARP